MEFWKMNGAGNDFIIIRNYDGSISPAQYPALAATLCRRRMSIGADGLMIVEPSEIADFKMLFFNSDGSMGEMCGNGARCICRYGYESGLSGETQTIETTAGIVTGERLTARNYRIRLNDPTTVEHRPVEVDGTVYDGYYVELGNPGLPHAVIPIPNLKEYPEEELFALGRKLRYHPAYPKGANVNFYELIGEDHLYERTWERGVEGFTYACGTGTGSVVTVLTMTGAVSGTGVAADMTGGRLTVDLITENGKPKDLFLTGPTNIAAKGTVTDEELIV